MPSRTTDEQFRAGCLQVWRALVMRILDRNAVTLVEQHFGRERERLPRA
jgi:hypothetical protein